MNVEVQNGTMLQDEIDYYVKFLQDKNKGQKIESLSLEICDDGYVNANYKLTPVPFQRIRRITGYLVGTTDRWNTAKRAELEERIKHM